MPKTQPQKEITETEFFKRLAEKLEELFPKGKCQERGQALAFNAYANIIFRDITQPQKIEDVREYIENKFTGILARKEWGDDDVEDILDDIEELLKSEKEKLLERIKLERKEVIAQHLDAQNNGYNKAIADLEKLKKELRNED